MSDYGVLNKNAQGGVSLTKKWLKQNLGIDAEDMILYANFGDMVCLMKFNPKEQLSEHMKTVENMGEFIKKNKPDESGGGD